jgi:methionyl-tRNA formyltransferase
MRIVFFGTPTFAAHALQALIHNKCNIVAVVTAPDKPAGRGMQLQSSEVKKCAEANQIPVLQPAKLKDPEFIAELAAYKADLQIVIAFRMLPEVVWQMPPLGTMNLHASLLPDYRGAAPINWAIINGETQTGVCTFFLQHEIDTGDILLSKTHPIGPETNAGELHNQLMELGAQTVLESVQLIAAGQTKGIPQQAGSHKIAPKLFKDDCLLDFTQDVKQVYNRIRGLSPYPAAFFVLDGNPVKVFTATYKLTDTSSIKPGTLLSDDKTYVHIACKNGLIQLLEIQPASKKRMDIASFLRGYDLPAQVDI